MNKAMVIILMFMVMITTTPIKSIVIMTNVIGHVNACCDNGALADDDDAVP